MYKVLIAEDSKPILRNIRMLLQSGELPVDIAATAANGEEALGIIAGQPIDILITDIRMPRLDGLTLIQEARKLAPDLQVVLISGYSDFEYTRKALNLQVFDYLLKPVERDQLLEVMSRLIQRLQDSQPDRSEMLRGIVFPNSEEDMALGDRFHDQPKVLFVLRKQPFTPNDRWRSDHVQKHLASFLSPHACWVFHTQESGQLLLLVDASVTRQYTWVTECMDAMRQHLLLHGIHASVAGQFHPATEDLADLYKTASDKLAHQLSVFRPVIVDAGIQTAGGSAVHDNGGKWSGDGTGDGVRNTDFAEAIRQRQKERVTLLLQEQLQKWRNEYAPLAELETLLLELADAFRQLSPAPEPHVTLGLEQEARRLLELENYDHFGAELVRWTEQCFDRLASSSRKSSAELFRQIDEYVQMNMYSHIAITDLADKFHVSPSYISRIVKQHTGETFVHYYLDLKIKVACKLIESKPDMKMKELSDILSFSDQHYFSKVFKEYAGCSPTAYRDKLPQQTRMSD